MINDEDVPFVLPQTTAATDAHRAVPTLDLRSCAQAEERPPGQPQCAAPPVAAPVASAARAASTAPAAEASKQLSQSSLRAAARNAEHAPCPPHIKGEPADRKACQAPAESPPPPDIDVPTRAADPCGRGQSVNSNNSLCTLPGTPRSSESWNKTELQDGAVRTGALASCAQALRYGCKWLFCAICPRRSGSCVSEFDVSNPKGCSKQPDEECPQEPEHVGGMHSTPLGDCPKLEPTNRCSEDLMRGAPDLRFDSAKDGGEEALQSTLPHTPTTPRAVEATVKSSAASQDKSAQATPSHSKDQPSTSQFSSNGCNSTSPEGPTVSEPADPKGTSTSSEAAVAAPTAAAVSTLERTVDAIMWRLREVTPPAERKRVFIEQCRAWHPDRNAGDLRRATLAFQRLQATRVWFLCSDEELIAMFGGAGLVNGH